MLSIKNEPILDFKPGSSEREEVLKNLVQIQSKTEEIPLVIGGEEIWTNDVKYQVCVCKLVTVYKFYKFSMKRCYEKKLCMQPC